EIDDIKTEFHPHSGKPVVVETFEAFSFNSLLDPAQVPADFEPWKPFRTRFDYEVSEFALRANLNKEMTGDLIDLLHKAANHSDQFTIQSSTEMQKLWDLASVKYPAFEKKKISVSHQGLEGDFDVSFRPLWDWVVDIATNPRLCSELEWDARKYSKFDGQQWKYFIDEPWTAKAWWHIQSELPADGKPFLIILYADKSKLSSFGTQKGYPVIARCANLPSHIRNGVGIGGGRVVGWLPIVRDFEFFMRYLIC
ncbi:hypothetical protein K435DRAFT_679108, partial [Dendrothele bispora CBS 962.96]